MYISDNERWQSIEIDTSVGQLARNCPEKSEETTLQDFHRKGLIAAAHRRLLPFYNNYDLYRFTIDVAEAGLSNQYSTAYLFFIASQSRARLLNGQSGVIHEINALEFSANGEMQKELRLTTDIEEIEYLEFFCSFVAGDAGPFFIVQHSDDLKFGTTETVQPIENFENLYERRRTRYNWPDAPITVDKSEVETFHNDREAALRKLDGRVKARNEKAQAVPSFESITAAVEPIEPNEPIRGENGDREAGQYKAIVWYGPALFRADFKVPQNGTVEMVDDEPVADTGLPSWLFLKDRGLMVRTASAEREKFRAADIESLLQDDSSPESLQIFKENQLSITSDLIRFRNITISGDLDLSGYQSNKRIQFENVIFLDEFRLREAVLSKGIRLEKTSILGRFDASGMRALRFEAPDLKIGGIYDWGSLIKEKGFSTHGLSLTETVISERLDLTDAMIRGGANLSRIRCHGPADLSGISIQARLPFSHRAGTYFRGENANGQHLESVDRLGDYTKADSGLNMSYGRFDDDVQINGNQEAEEHAVVSGGIDLTNAQISGDLSLRGLQSKQLDLLIPPAEVVDLEAILTKMEEDDDLKVLFDPHLRSVAASVPEPRSGDLSMDDISVSHNLNSASYPGLRTQIEGFIVCNRSKIGAVLNLSGTSVAFVANEGLAGEIQFRDAKIGTVVCNTLDSENLFFVAGRMIFEFAQISDRVLALGARILGYCDFDNVEIGGSLDLGPSQGADSNCTEMGGLFLNSSEIRGVVKATSIQIEGRLDASNSKLNGLFLDYDFETSTNNPTQADVTDAIQAHLSGGGHINTFDVEAFLTDWRVQNAPEKANLRRARAGSVELHSATCSGSVILTAAQITNYVSLYGANISGTVSLSGAEIGGDVSLSGAHVGEMLDGNISDRHPFRTLIAGDLILSGAQAHSDVRFCGAKIDGDVKAITGSFKRIQFRFEYSAVFDEQNQPNGEYICFPSEVGGFIGSSVEIGDLDLDGLRCKENIELTSVRIKERLQFFSLTRENYLLFGITDEDELAGKRAALNALDNFGAKIGGEFRAKSLSVGNEIDLRKLECTGDIRFVRLQLDGDLDVSSQLSDVWSSSNPEENLSLGRANTNCRSFDISGAHIAGSVRLDGLNLTDRLVASYAFIGRELNFCHPKDSDRCLKVDTRVNLIGASANKVRLKTDRCCGQNPILVNMENGQFNLLELVGRPVDRLKLKNAKVENWSFDHREPDGTGQDSETLDEGQLLLNYLKNEDFDQAVWHNAEMWLRKRGDDDNADELHRRTRKLAGKHRRNPTGSMRPLKWIFSRPDWFLDKFIHVTTGYWTRGWQVLAYLCLPVFLFLTLPISNIPANIAPSPLQLGEERSSDDAIRRTDQPATESWKPIFVAQIAMNNHVPIVPLVLEPRWELRDDRDLLYVPPLGIMNMLPESWQGKHQAELSSGKTVKAWKWPISPSMFGFIIKIISWIAWPLALIGLATNIRRRHDR